MKDLKVEIRLVNQKVQFTAVSETNADMPLTLDYVPPIGDGKGFAGLELLLMSFSGCVSTAIVSILRKMGKNIGSYQVNVTGVRQENPLSLIQIIFSVVIKSDNIQSNDMERAFRIAESISPVWLAIKDNVEVVMKYEVIAE